MGRTAGRFRGGRMRQASDKTAQDKKAAIDIIDTRRSELIEISLEIHANPELCFKEFKASKLLADYLTRNGL